MRWRLGNFPGSVSVLEGHRGAGAAGAPSRHRLKVYGFAAQSAEKFLTTVIFFDRDGDCRAAASMPPSFSIWEKG